MKTNKGLVEFVKVQLKDPRNVYMLGGFGWILNGPPKSGHHSVDTRIANGCPHTIQNERIIRRGIGGKAFDCVGLIKGYYWSDPNGKILYKIVNGVRENDSDLGANRMHAVAKIKGPMSTLPEKPGVILWLDGHTGVYIGNGEVIEATPGFGFRVVKTQFKSRALPNYRGTWTHWFESPYIVYEKEEKDMKYKVGDVVRVKGLAISSTATSNNNVTTHGEIRRVFEDGRRYPYLIGTAGWVNDSLILGLFVPEVKPDSVALIKQLRDEFNKKIDEILATLG